MPKLTHPYVTEVYYAAIGWANSAITGKEYDTRLKQLANIYGRS